MKIVFQSKILLSVIIFLMLGVMFIYFLNFELNLISNGIYWVASLILTLLFYYLSFVISSLLQIVFIKSVKLFPLKVFSLYPVTFDGAWRFLPIKLIYNIEGFSNSLILNLSQVLDDEKQLMQKLKQLLILRKCCTFFAYGILFLLLHQFNLKTVLVFSIAYFSTNLLSYFQYGYLWYGYDYIFSQGSGAVVEYLYAAKSIMFLDSNQYAQILEKECNNEIFQLSIIENYLYRCILERNKVLSAKLLRSKMSKYINLKQFFEYDLFIDTKRLNIIKLIGWAGIQCQNRDTLQLSLDIYINIYDSVLINSYPVFLKHGTKTMKDEINYLKSNQIGNPCQLHLQDMQNVFSVYDDIFTS